jgi:hypothetical protein
MTNRIRASRPGSTFRLAVFCGLAATALSGTLNYPAYADNDNDHQNKHWNNPRQVQAHQQNWQQTHWQAQRYHQPDVYYTAPPVVYPPPGYYQQQPGPSLTLSIPFLYN